MRKIREIVERNGYLKREGKGKYEVQTRFLDFVLAWKGSRKELEENLKKMYEITIDKREISATIEDLPFSIGELLAASDILAWILKISKRTHKKNKKAIKKL